MDTSEKARFRRIKTTVNEGLACVLTERDIAWLVEKVERLEAELDAAEDLIE